MTTPAPLILIVEDEAEIAELLEENLHALGFETCAVRDGAGLFDALSRRKPSLILLDIMLPGEDGLSLCKRLRVPGSGFETVPIIFLSALGELADRVVGLEIGADDYLAKPFEMRELVARIRALLRLSSVLAFAAQLVDLVLPILAGGILALFINVPMTGLEKRLKRLFCKAKKQSSDKVLHLLSFFITLLGVVLVLVLALTLLIPELVQSFHSLYVQIEANIPRWTAYLSAQDADMGWLMSWLEGIDWEQLLHRVTDSIDTVLVNAVGAVSATVNIVVTASFALIISVYMSVGSESLCHHARTLVCAYLKPSHADWLLKFCRLFRQSFANFLTGQCSEAVILGVLTALAFPVFKIPYGSLVGMLTAICAIIPYVGALISCVVSVFLVLLVDPVLAVRCLIVYLAVQFIENQFIYPRVVGKSVGLSPLYTLVAAMIGGKLFGIIGIIFFIPLTAVIIELVKEDACRRIQAREPQ